MFNYTLQYIYKRVHYEDLAVLHLNYMGKCNIFVINLAYICKFFMSYYFSYLILNILFENQSLARRPIPRYELNYYFPVASVEIQ